MQPTPRPGGPVVNGRPTTTSLRARAERARTDGLRRPRGEAGRRRPERGAARTVRRRPHVGKRAAEGSPRLRNAVGGLGEASAGRFSPCGRLPKASPSVPHDVRRPPEGLREPIPVVPRPSEGLRRPRNAVGTLGHGRGRPLHVVQRPPDAPGRAKSAGRPGSAAGLRGKTPRRSGPRAALRARRGRDRPRPRAAAAGGHPPWGSNGSGGSRCPRGSCRRGCRRACRRSRRAAGPGGP